MTTSIANEPNFEPSLDPPTVAPPSPVTSHRSAEPSTSEAMPSRAADATVEMAVVDPQPVGVSSPDQGYLNGQPGYPPPGYPAPPSLSYPPASQAGYPGYSSPGAQPAFGQWAPYGAHPSQTNGFTGPAAWPVAIFTVIFGVFGAISAARRSSDARALGLPTAPYWWTFGGSLVGGFVLWMLSLGILIAVAVPLFEQSRNVMNADQLEVQLMQSSAAGVTVTQADCVDDSVNRHGAGTYRCQVTFSDGGAESYPVTVDDDGTWAAGNPD